MQTDSLTDGFSAVVETISAKKSQFRLEFALAVGAMIIAYLWMINTKVDGIAYFALPAFGFFGFYNLQHYRYRRHSSTHIMLLLCDAIDGIRYNGLKPPKILEREKELLLPMGTFDRAQISISGSFDEQWFHQNNVILRDNSGEHTEVTFRGVVLKLPSINVAPPLLVRPESRKRGALTTWIFGADDPMPARASLGKLSDFGEDLTLFAPDDATLAEYAPKLANLIKQSDAVFTDSATVDAVLITQNSTWIAIADGSLPFSTGGVFQSKAALTRDIERASRELAVPIRLMQIWADGFRTALPEPN